MLVGKPMKKLKHYRNHILPILFSAFAIDMYYIQYGAETI